MPDRCTIPMLRPRSSPPPHNALPLSFGLLGSDVFSFFAGYRAVGIAIWLTLFCSNALISQPPLATEQTDTAQDLRLMPDTAAVRRANLFTATVDYNAEDSVRLDLFNNKVYLFGSAIIKYGNIQVEADYVEVDFNTKTLFATGMPDSAGVMRGMPVFTEGKQSFKANTMRYNFESKRGYINKVITQEGDGYLHGRLVKKMEDDITNVRDGSYTTCNLEHPHFEFRYQKAKVIPGKKIVTGPVYLTIADVPLPLVIPFGLIPNKKGQTSGILPPSWGESAERGFYFENGGYYFGLSDHFELYLRGDIYTRGSWAVKPSLNYRKRYKYNGGFSFSLARNILGTEGTPNYQKRRDFSVTWNHNQDPKAHPVSRFTANVNVVTSKFNRYNPVSANNYLSNTFTSAVTYQTSFANKYYLNAGLNHTQNTLSRIVTLTTPDVSFSMNRIYPFRRQTRVGAIRWYENISMNYTMNARNEISTPDSLLFSEGALDKFRNGVRHSIPINSTVRVLKYFNMSTSANFTERWYFQRIEQRWDNEKIVLDTVSGFRSVHDFDVSSSLSTTLYGLVQFKKGPLRALRHVMYPSVGFSYRPDFGAESWGYWSVVQINNKGKTQRYSYYQNSLFGTPPDRKSGSLNISLSHNLEAKVRSKSDTISGMRKVKLIEGLTMSASYDMTRDSLRWSGVFVGARTTLFNQLQLSFNGMWTPYAKDSQGRSINKFVWETDRKLLRRDNVNFRVALSYSINSSTFGKKETDPAIRKPVSDFGTPQELAEIGMFPQNFIDWNQPWNFSFNYSFMLTNLFSPLQNKFETKTIQTFDFNGDINLTPKWKVAFNSGYDFISKQISYTSFNIHRDLHCWEMRFNWIPTGGMKSWNFQINAKSSVLQDLKLTRKKDFRDY